ncbi:Redoxin domain protein [Pseudogulbenkiania sp. NH8B]|nr:Redoxin domain protein [Pseudogulbenkiania sp. NH8B]
MYMFTLQHRDDALQVLGDFPQVGNPLHSFMLVDENLNDVSLEQFHGSPKAIITLLSLDEQEYGGIELLQETRRFLEQWPGLRLFVISVDSPSTLRRARREHGLPGVTLLSTLRGRDFHKFYGVLIADYPLAGYTAPSLILTDSRDQVIYAERLRGTEDLFDFASIAKTIEGR